MLPTQEDTTDEGLHRLMVRSTYTGTVSEAPEAATPAQAKPEPAKPEPAKPEAKPPAGAAPELRARRLSRVRRLARYPRPRHEAAAQDAEVTGR